VNATLAWQAANQDYLSAAMQVVRARLELGLGIEHDLPALLAEETRARQALPAASALDQVEATFGLSPFERDLLVLVAASDVLPAVGEACAALHQDPVAAYPTFALALAFLPEPSWASLTPEAPLRKFRLIEVSDGPSFTRSRVRLPERVLHFLCGVICPDPALASLDTLSTIVELAPSHERIAESAAETWRKSKGDLPPILLVGSRGMAVAARAAKRLNLRPYAVPASGLPADLPGFVDLWNREALLLSAALVVEVDGTEHAPRAAALAKRARFPMFLVAPDDLRVANAVTFDVPTPSTREMAEAWRHELGPAAATLNGQVETLAGQFRLTPEEISQVAHAAAGQENFADALWAGARRRSRQALDGLAERIEPRAGWSDLVLPESHLTTLRQISAHVRQRAKVYHAWGFAERSGRGLAISALFSGPSGTGKTLASEVIAGSLGLDLYRIDLSQIVSKYIGETEKNLRRIFEAAEGSGAVLLFDEADALFGKRSEVRDSHDRYANIEVAYLLQRMEAYGGLVILTTNLKNTLDPAFMRRIRFVLPFPFPEHDDRRRIWETVFPAGMPRDGIDVDRLATLSLAGGSIRNIALNAAFLAADAGTPVRMEDLLLAARSEFAKLERPMTEFELGGTA